MTRRNDDWDDQSRDDQSRDDWEAEEWERRMRAPSAPGTQPAGSQTGDFPLRSALARWAKVDFAPAHRQPRPSRFALAVFVSAGGSLALCALAVHVGTSLYPTTRHFSHFEFSDYGTLTVLGVLAGCVAWPVVTRLTSAPRWLLLRLAILTTVALWLPDGWLLLRGENANGVAVLMVMHLAIAVVTYNALVRLAPVRPPAASAPGRISAAPKGPAALRAPRELSERSVRRIWNAMALLNALELVVGVATIAVVPFKRTDALVPARGAWIYVVHGGLGAILAVGALGVLALSPAAGRLPRIGAAIGAAGVGVGLAGGVMASFGSTRLLGMGLMLVGVVVAGIGYLAPALEAFGKAEAARAGVPPRRTRDKSPDERPSP